MDAADYTVRTTYHGIVFVVSASLVFQPPKKFQNDKNEKKYILKDRTEIKEDLTQGRRSPGRNLGLGTTLVAQCMEGEKETRTCQAQEKERRMFVLVPGKWVYAME